MKKITFILFALIAGTTFGQTTISSSAEIIEAISFVENSGLSFGKIDNAAGTVTITPAGVITGKTQISGGSALAGKLTVSGEAEEAYSLTVSETAVLTGPSSATMNVSAINHNASEILDASGDEIVNIGGTLTVGEGQAAGTYEGTISVTVSYN